MNGKSIYTGWKNLIIQDVEIEIMAAERTKICDECKYNKFNFCKLCKCFIPSKIRSKQEYCPLRLWSIHYTLEP